MYIDQSANQQMHDSIRKEIKREASSMDLLHRLVNAVPNQNHRNHINYALQNKQVQLKAFIDLYLSLTGRQPEYRIDQVAFHSYQDGLQKAFQIEEEGCWHYQNCNLRSQHPYVQQIFSQAFTMKKDNAARFEWLCRDIPNEIKDYGGRPFVVNIDEATKRNDTYRTALWTGDKLQVTLMSIDVGDDIGLEVHPTTDQFLRLEEGQGLVQMGDSQDQLDFEEMAYDGYAIMIPAGKWHNLTNTGNTPIKLYAIYAPPEHPFGTVHETKAIAMASEEHE